MPSEPEETSLDDPKLKAAVKRVLGGGSVPSGLRERIVAEVFDAPPPPILMPIPIRRTPWLAFAAAAVLLLGVGTVGWYVLNVRNAGNTQLAVASLPDSFARGLVRTHDHCCAEPDHHVLKDVPDDDFRLMSQKLRESLGYPALAAAAGEGWSFKGASAMCPVNTVRSAHLVFKKGDESLSIFSVAVASQNWPDGGAPKDGAHYDNDESGHPIISWVRGGVVYSVVAANAAGSMKISDIQPIADRLQGAVLAAEDQESHVTLASSLSAR